MLQLALGSLWIEWPKPSFQERHLSSKGTQNYSVRPQQATEICNFRALSPLDFCSFSSEFGLFLQLFEPFDAIPETSGEGSENTRRRKMRKILSGLWLSWLFQPRIIAMFFNVQPSGSFEWGWCRQGRSEHSSFRKLQLLANQSKTEVRHFCLKLYKTRCTFVKRDRKLPAQKIRGMVRSRRRSERDTNLHYLRPVRETSQGSMPVYTRIFLIGMPGVLNTPRSRYTPEKRDWHDFLAINVCRRSYSY